MFLLHVGPIQKKKLFESHTLWGREIGISFDDKWPAKPTEKWTILGTPQKGGPFLKTDNFVCKNQSVFADVFAFSVSFAYCLRGEHVSCCVSILEAQLLTCQNKKFFIANKIKLPIYHRIPKTLTTWKHVNVDNVDISIS